MRIEWPVEHAAQTADAKAHRRKDGVSEFVCVIVHRRSFCCAAADCGCSTSLGLGPKHRLQITTLLSEPSPSYKTSQAMLFPFRHFRRPHAAELPQPSDCPKLPLGFAAMHRKRPLITDSDRLHLAWERPGSGRRCTGAIRGRHDQYQAARQGLASKSERRDSAQLGVIARPAAELGGDRRYAEPPRRSSALTSVFSMAASRCCASASAPPRSSSCRRRPTTFAARSSRA